MSLKKPSRLWIGMNNDNTIGWCFMLHIMGMDAPRGKEKRGAASLVPVPPLLSTTTPARRPKMLGYAITK